MKIKIHIAKYIGVFNGPVTIRKSERLNLEFNRDGVLFLRSANQTIRRVVSEGKTSIDLIDVPDGQYDLSLHTPTAIPLGRLTVSDGRATVSPMNADAAIMILTLALDDAEKRIEKNESEIKKLHEQNQIGLAQRKEKEQ